LSSVAAPDAAARLEAVVADDGSGVASAARVPVAVTGPALRLEDVEGLLEWAEGLGQSTRALGPRPLFVAGLQASGVGCVAWWSTALLHAARCPNAAALARIIARLTRLGPGM
jgi:hypothetical protein